METHLVPEWGIRKRIIISIVNMSSNLDVGAIRGQEARKKTDSSEKCSVNGMDGIFSFSVNGSLGQCWLASHVLLWVLAFPLPG